MQNWIIRFITSLFLVAMIAGCAGGPNKESTGDYIDDATITTKVKTLLIGETALKAFQINVETFKGVVQLSGFVDSQTTANKAIEVANRVKGVTSVKNNMILK